MFGLGFGELILILIIALIFIGPKKLPEVAKGLGKGLREFQNATKGFSDQLQENIKEVSQEINQEATSDKVADATQQEASEVVEVKQDDNKSTPS